MAGNVSYDKSAPRAKLVILSLIFLVLLLALSIIGVFYLTKTSKDQVTITGLTQLDRPYEVEQLRKYEESILSEYGIVNSEKGLYRIPIDKAMDKVIEDYR